MPDVDSFEALTDGVMVRVRPRFLDDESSPENHRYIWAYTVVIENRGGRTLQLMTRYWRITDCEGRTQEVEGVGVVGQTPVLRPGERFEYTSGAPLAAPSGVMQGIYQLEDDLGGVVEARIPLFALDSPYDTRNPS
jgi:ApaG protein